MMSMLLSLFFMIPLLFIDSWWLIVICLMLLFFYFYNTFWFTDFYSMMSYSLGGDVLSMSMIFLSIWIVFLMIMASMDIYCNDNHYAEFVFVNLVLLIFLILSFSTSDLFYFYVYFESTFIPILFLIFGWGYQSDRLSAGFYLLFYTFLASMPLFLIIFYIWDVSDTLDFFLIDMDFNLYSYLALIVAFLVSSPLFFVHFWLPKAHVQSPISGSMILAGVLMKLGGYGLIRVLYFMDDFSMNYNYIFVGLSLYGSVMVGFLCLYQLDMKSMIAYSSVAHMGLVICGIMTMNHWGLYGSLYLMVGHGLCSSGLFCLANIVYESTHSRSFIINSGLISLMPSLSLFWFILSSNNMGSPPSLNLFGEVLLINSVMGWGALSLSLLALSSFLSCCYSMYLYTDVQHGSIFSGVVNADSVNCREYILVALHLIPLNLLILDCDYTLEL